MCHELAFVDGEQVFRRIDDDGKVGKAQNAFPAQKRGVWTQSDWADTLGEIADNSWTFLGAVDDHYMFTFDATAEDERCEYEEYSQGIPLFGGGHPGWKGSVDCFEVVLTDNNFNVVSVFAELHPPDGCVTRYIQTGLYFDWVTLAGIKSPILLPVRERIAAKVRAQKDLWYANVTWSEYEKFRAQHRIRF